MTKDELLICALSISLVFAVTYVIAALIFFGKAGILVAGYNFEPKAPKAKKLHGKIMRRFGVAIFVICLFIHGTVMAFLFGENVLGGVLTGVSVAVSVLILILVNTGRTKEWTREERRLEEEYRKALSEKNEEGKKE